MTDRDPDESLRDWIREVQRLARSWGPGGMFLKTDTQRMADALTAVLDACTREDVENENYGEVSVRELRERIAESLDWNGGDWHG